jgi:hypothetical protein
MQRISRKEFEAVWQLWPEYKTGKVLRKDLTPVTRNSKYTISIFHWLETEK